MCFQLHLEKLEKEAEFFLGEITLYYPPLTALKILWNFSFVYSCLRDPFAQPFQKGGKGIKYREANQNGWHLLSQTSHNKLHDVHRI